MYKKNKRNNEDFWMFKAPLELKKEFDKIRIERIRLGKDNPLKPKTYKRLGLALANHKKLLKDLAIADMPELNEDILR